MPQTVEAINHARAAEVPIIVAINKIDKANAEPEKVQRELAEEGLLPEDWGGETIFVPVSAKTHEGLDDLLEMVLLQAEMLELKANPEKPAIGHVVEARLDSGRGPVATVLVKEGTLSTGAPVVCGVHFGRVRAMLNDSGQQVQTAGPAMPVEVIGLSGVPMAGDDLVALKDERSAKQVSMHRQQRHRSKELAKTNRLSLDKLYENLQAGEAKDLNVIIKADVNGSIEALRDSMANLSNNEVNINVVHSATGTITESDVSLATVSDAIIIGFNVRPTPKVQEMAQEEHVDMRFYNVIYDVIKDIQDAMVGMMESTFEERVQGRAEVRDTFHIPRVGTIAGCYVTDGRIERGALIRVLRDGVISYDGKIGSLRRFKDDTKEVLSGFECGIGIENFNDIKIGDVLESYYLEEIKPVIQ
jgi:translation initiation factor IF-2